MNRDKEKRGNKKGSISVLKELESRITTMKSSLRKEISYVKSLRSQLDQVQRTIHQAGIYNNTDTFNIESEESVANSRQRHRQSFPELPMPNSYNEPFIINLNPYLHAHDEVLASKLSIDNIPDIQNLLTLEEKLWKDIVMNTYNFGPTTTYSNFMVKLSPRHETNLLIMDPYFKVIFQGQELDTGLIAEDNTSNPLSLSKLVIIQSVIKQSIAGLILEGEKERLELKQQLQLQHLPKEHPVTLNTHESKLEQTNNTSNLDNNIDDSSKCSV